MIPHHIEKTIFFTTSGWSRLNKPSKILQPNCHHITGTFSKSFYKYLASKVIFLFSIKRYLKVTEPCIPVSAIITNLLIIHMSLNIFDTETKFSNVVVLIYIIDSRKEYVCFPSEIPTLNCLSAIDKYHCNFEGIYMGNTI